MRASLLKSAGEALRRTSSSAPRRSYASAAAAPERKVAILGAAGGIGYPLSLLMKRNPLVSRLALYDIAGTPGVAADVSHINTRAEDALQEGFGLSLASLPSTSILGFPRQSAQARVTTGAPRRPTRSHACSSAKSVASSADASHRGPTHTSRSAHATTTGRPREEAPSALERYIRERYMVVSLHVPSAS